MIFWIIILAMALVTAGLLMLGFRRGNRAAEPAAAYDLRVYRDQLAEVDRDLARGVLDEQDAERVRTEISRRILAADAALTEETGGRKATRDNLEWMAVPAFVLVAGSAFLYLQLGAPGYGDLSLKDRIAAAQTLRETRPSQDSAEASIDPASLPRPAEPDEQYAGLVDKLREVVAERPDDTRGLRLLAASERNLGNYAAAHRAFFRYVELRGADATAEEYADLADLMVLAAGGYVSPEAETVLEQALARDPNNGPARYYWGLMLAQTGRPDQAFRIWDGLLRQSTAEAPWVPPITAQIGELSRRAGVSNYSMPEPSGERGPSAADVEAAGQMSSADRLQMIEGMVSGLSDRLATEGGSVDEWAQLITALGVLGRSTDARSVYEEARARFSDQPGALDRIDAAGERAGIAN